MITDTRDGAVIEVPFTLPADDDASARIEVLAGNVWADRYGLTGYDASAGVPAFTGMKTLSGRIGGRPTAFGAFVGDRTAIVKVNPQPGGAEVRRMETELQAYLRLPAAQVAAIAATIPPGVDDRLMKPPATPSA